MQARPAEILLIEDNPGDMELVHEAQQQLAAGWDANSPARAQRVAQRCAAAACGIVLLALAGWLLDVRLLAGQWRGGLPMAPSTALAFLFLSGGVFSHARWSTHPLSRRIALAAAGLAAMLGLLVLARFITGGDWGVELALTRTHELSGRIPLGRMSPLTAGGVLLESGALLFLLHTTRWRFAASVAALLALMATVGSLVILLGYSYGDPLLYGAATIPVSLPTALAMVLVGVAQIKLTLPGVAALRAWRGDSMRGVLLRAFLPTMLGFILLWGWVEAVAPVGAPVNPAWDALTALVACALIVAIVAWIARRIGDTIDRLQEARKQAEEALRRRTEELARSNAELERFAYVASHDLQEPLRMVASFTQLLAKRYSGELDETADRYIHYAVDGAKRMQQLIADLLAYSRVNSKGLDLRQTDCEAVVLEAMRNLQVVIEESGAAVDWDPLAALCVDQGQLTQVFQNLLANAIKFRREEECPRIHVSAVDSGAEWTISVQDNGIGIDARHAEHVFQMFQRLHTRAEYPGTGIGLAICKKVVERHGGKLWVESVPGAGSTFRFTIPKPERNGIEGESANQTGRDSVD